MRLCRCFRTSTIGKVPIESVTCLGVFVDLVLLQDSPLHLSLHHVAILINTRAVRVIEMIGPADADGRVPRQTFQNDLVGVDLNPAVDESLEPLTKCFFALEFCRPGIVTREAKANVLRIEP